MRRRSLGTWVLRRSRPRSPRSSSCTTEATTNSSRRFVPMRFRRCSSGIRNRPCEIVDGSRSSAKSPRLAGTCWWRKPGGNRSWRRAGNTSVLPGFDSSLAKCFNPMGPVYRRTMISEPEILDVREPPGKAMGKVAELWKPVEGTNKIMCTACARYCKIGEGQAGLCGIRGVHEGKLWLYVYGRVITGHVDPIEKKPVSHYRPGSKIFSIATTGCNWLCRYCQNADISQRRKVEGIEVEPQDVVRMTLEQGCQGLAYTYNQPTIFIEFARDIGMLARKAGLINIFVSNGYDTPETVAEMPKFLDCVTVDFKGSGETNFVRKYINIPNADPIFQTILDTRDTKKIHIEITDLIVPQVGDDLGAARKLSKWVYDNLGPDTPIHFLRFHPDYKMMEFPWTPVETLEKHCAVAKEEGLRYVYIGNVSGHRLENTYCPGCGAIAIKRYGFDITGWYLGKDNRCKKCGYKLAIFGRLEQTAKENRFYSVLYHR